MLQHVDVGERSLDAYRGTVAGRTLDELRDCAAHLRGARVLHINATPYGGGVSELLRSLVPLLNDLGLIADWRIITGDQTFFQVTKAIHNGLQGAAAGLDEKQKEIYVANTEHNARLLQEEYDFVFVHDPQPAGVLPVHGKGAARWVWRCHIDTSCPNPEVWEFLRAYLPEYDAAVFTMAEFVPPDCPVEKIEIIPPAIDPLSPKNFPLPAPTARRILEWIGVRSRLPLVTQVARFDPWKDPLGVIDAYRIARRDVPELQLALVGSMALDDPEGWDVYRRIQSEADADPLIHVYTNLIGVGNIEVNAFQRVSDVVVQKSIREGFGLVVSEALWKGTPVVAGRAGGIPLQMADGVGGLLVDGVEGCAEAIVRLLRDPAGAKRAARTGRERVRRHFLLPRLLLNEALLMLELARTRPIQREALKAGYERDPVCGMAICERRPESTASYGGREYFFCADVCRARFLENPTRYAGC